MLAGTPPRSGPCAASSTRPSRPPSRRSLPERPDLDPAEPRDRMRRGHLHRLVDIRALEDVEAADDLLGLGERAVADHDLAVPHLDRLGLARRPEPVAVQPDTAGDHVIEPRKAAVVPAVSLSSSSFLGRLLSLDTRSIDAD